MAEKTSKSKKSAASKKPSMRDLAGGNKKRRLKSGKSSFIRRILRPVWRPFGWFFKKLGRFVPGYFKGAWSEIKQTTWPGRRETFRLTLAVFIFSSVFAVFVAILDLILDKVFRHIIVK